MKRVSRAEKYGVSERAYKEYFEKYDPCSPKNIESKRRAKNEKRKNWWANNWIAFASMIISIIAVVIALLK